MIDHQDAITLRKFEIHLVYLIWPSKSIEIPPTADS